MEDRTAAAATRHRTARRRPKELVAAVLVGVSLAGAPWAWARVPGPTGRAVESDARAMFEYATTCRVAGAGAGDHVTYRTEDGTAVAGADYSPTSGWLDYRGGTVYVPLIDDADVEADETVRIVFQYSGFGTCDHPLESRGRADDRRRRR